MHRTAFEPCRFQRLFRHYCAVSVSKKSFNSSSTLLGLGGAKSKAVSSRSPGRALFCWQTYPSAIITCHASIINRLNVDGLHLYHKRHISNSQSNSPGKGSEQTLDKMNAASTCSAFPLETYEPPDWAANILQIPKHKIQLAMSGTPIHRWFLPSIPERFEVYIKRDDMTGSSLSGNKIRKLEFLLADARTQGCDTVITCGSVRSNHCRTTAIAARQMGLDCHLLLRSDGSSGLKGSFTGNTLLDRMVGCHFYLLPKKSTYIADIYPRMQQLIEHLRISAGKKAYPIPVGGSNAVGVFGYIECFRELLLQGVQEKFTDIVVTTGSSGSLAGLAIGNYLTGSRLKITGMAVCDDAKYFHGEINRVLKELGLQGGQGSPEVRSEDIAEVVEGVKGLGYGISQPEELECINLVARTTGIFVDPVYTGKATYHLMRLLREDPGRFRGNKILFIHTGGTFDVFSGKLGSLVDSKTPAENKVFDWMELSNKPPLSQ